MKLYGRAGYLTYPGVPHLHVNRSLEPCHLKTSLRPLLMMKSSQLKCQVSTRYLKLFAIKMDGGMSTIQISLLNMTLTGVVYTSTLKELPDLRQILLIT